MSKKGRKFVPINANDNVNYVLPGRIKCDCAATKHELINNCLGCGRIVCVQEGAGPCWFCGELVCDNKDLDKITNNQNKGSAILKYLQDQKWPHQKDDNIDIKFDYMIPNNPDSLLKAEESKNRLLEFDRTSAKRTKVIDDQNDYYNIDGNSWLTPVQRDLLKNKEKKLREKRFEASWKKPKTLSVDFKTGKITEEIDNKDYSHELFEDPEIYSIDTTDPLQKVNIDTSYFNLHKTTKIKLEPSEKEISKTRQNKLQDTNAHIIRDNGMCISMHQPWASLLVKGIIKHEGRSWYSNHRGILWIAATAKETHKKDIEDCQKFCMDRGVSKSLFLEDYPVGCILGCVEMVDCLPQEDYVELYPNGESNSPYCFICENPRELSIKFPIKGQHKIYKLDQHIHQAAKAGIR